MTSRMQEALTIHVAIAVTIPIGAGVGAANSHPGLHRLRPAGPPAPAGLKAQRRTTVLHRSRPGV